MNVRAPARLVWVALLLAGAATPYVAPDNIANADFVGPPAPRPKLPIITVVPLGDVDPTLIEFVAASLERRFYFEVRVNAPLPHPAAAWYVPRHRWRAEKILDALDELELGDTWRVAAITEAPISTTKGPVFDWGIAGLGSMDGKSCVFTAYLFRRFKQKEPETYRRFMENLIIHEVGHTLGLDHCPLDRCIMADAKGNAIRSARISTNEFCPRCHRLIQRYLRAAAVQGTWSAAELRLVGESL